MEEVWTITDARYRCLDCGVAFYLTWARLPGGKYLWETDVDGETFLSGEGTQPLCPNCQSPHIADMDVERLLEEI